MTERETELKYLVPPHAGELLGTHVSIKHLVNRYFVVDQPVERRDWVLRLRLLALRKNELTLKIGREVQPGIFDSMEYSAQDVSEQPADWESLKLMRIFRREISPRPLVEQGESLTQRSVFEPPVPVGAKWEFDRCRLPDGSVFQELEIELSAEQAEDLEHHRGLVEDWLTAQGIDFEVSRKTKYRRFLEALA